MNTRIKELREKHGLTQYALAERVGSSQQAISRIENGSAVPPLDLMVNIANYFRVTLDYITCLSDTKQNVEIQLDIKAKIDENEDVIIMYEQLKQTNRETIKFWMKRLIEAQKEEEQHDKDSNM